MLNCFYWYAFAWGFILFMYLLSFSEFSMPLNNQLLFFIVSTSIISLVLGFYFRNSFRIKKANVSTRSALALGDIKIGYAPVIITSILYMLNFLYAGSIPLIGYLSGQNTYGDDLRPLPHVSVLMIIMALYYSVKYFYYFLLTKTKRYFICFGVLLFDLLLMFSRSQLTIVMIATFIIFLQFKNEQKKLINKKNIAAAFSLLAVALFGFGVLGNVREGYDWNDNTFIDLLGRYVSFPKFIPGQYKWFYSYAMSPLSNLNFNIEQQNTNFDLKYLLAQVLTESITNRFLPGYHNNMNSMLVRSYFTVSTGFCDSYIYGGIIGMYMLFFFFIGCSLFVIKMLQYNQNYKEKAVTLAFLAVMYVINFFQNTFWYTGTSLTFLFCCIVLIINVCKIDIGKYERIIVRIIRPIKLRIRVK